MNSRNFIYIASYNERGNVFFYILIAVTMLAALTYAVNESSRGNVSQLTTERAKLLASEIIEYGNVMANAIAQVRLRGTEDSELCFDDPAWGASDYDHAGCTDAQNTIFDVTGGGLNWTEAPSDAADTGASPDNLWHIYGDNEISMVGTTCGSASCSDLILITDELTQTVCIQINNVLGVTNPSDVPPVDSAFGTTRYVGSYSYTATIGDETGGEALQGQSAGCFQKTDAPSEYVFYKVLRVR